MKLQKCSTFVLSLFFVGSLAMAAPDSFVYEGVLADSNGPITTSATLILRLYDPALSCLLYEEQQTVTPDSNGAFSVRVGSAVADSKRTNNDPQLSMGNIFKSSGAIRSAGASYCSGGYSATVSEGRRLVINVNAVDLSPAVEISSAPFAISASTSDTIGTYEASKLVRSDGSVAVPALTDAKVTILMNILNGSLGASPAGSGDVASKGYVDAVASNQLALSTTFAGDVSGTASTLAVNKIKGVVIDTTGIATNKILKYNGTNWAIGDDLTGAGGTVSNVSGTAPIIVTNGTSTPVIGITQASSTADGFLTVGDWNMFNNKMGSALPSGAIWVGGASNSATAVYLNGDGNLSNSGTLTITKTTTAAPNTILALNSSGTTQVKGLELTNGSSVVTLAPVISGGVSYTLRMPASSPGANQLLKSDASGNLMWTNPIASLSVDNIIGVNGAQFPKTCKVSETLIWSAATDSFICVDIKQKDAAIVSSSNLTIYVGVSGSDTVCNGSAAASSSSPPNCSFATLQKAVNSLPDVIRHMVTIELTSDLTLAAAGAPLAIIDKVVAAQSLSTGPMLIIKASSGTFTINGMNYSESQGIAISSASRGVYIKNVNFNNFADEALRNDGGLVILENVTFNGNRRAISVSSGGRTMLMGTVGVNLPNSGGSDGSRGIEVHQGSVSSEGNVSIALGTGANNRGISIGQGDYSIENDMYINGSGSNYQTAIEVESGGTLEVRETKQLSIDLGSNTASSAVMVRSGRLNVSGTLSLSSIGNQGLICETNAICNIYGALNITTGNTNGSYVAVRSGSILNSGGNFSITANLANSNGSAVEITDNSIFAITSNMGTPPSVNITGGTSMASAFKVANNSQLKVDTFGSLDFNFSGYGVLVNASSMSFVSLVQPSSGSYGSLQLKNDDSSKIKYPQGAFMNPTRNCTGGLMSLGDGPNAFCIETMTNSAMNLNDASFSCASKGLKICSRRQYAKLCTTGTSILSNWTEGSEKYSCDSSTLATTTVADETLSNSNSYRCCQ